MTNDRLDPLLAQVQPVVHALRSTLLRLLEGTNADMRGGPTQLAKTLGTDPKLSWKLLNLLEQEDLLEAGCYIPGASAMRRFLAAMRGRGLDADTIGAVQDAMTSFEALVDAHAENRGDFDMMLAAHVGKSRARADAEHRRAGFRANSFFWGVRARLQFKSVVLSPSDDDALVDAVLLNGFVDLQRMRSRVSWRMSGAYSVTDHGEVRSPDERKSLLAGPDAADPFLPHFCEPYPAPVLSIANPSEGVLDYGLEAGPIGKTGVVTCIMGERLDRIEPRHATEDYNVQAAFLPMRTPCHAAVLDMFVHESLFDATPYRAALYSGLFAGEVFHRHHEVDEVPVDEVVKRIGDPGDRATIPEYFRYPELLDWSFERAGWDPASFYQYRIRLEYPPTPTFLVAGKPLPTRRDGDEPEAGDD